MAELPPRPDLDQLRRRAKELLRAARNGDAAAIQRIAAVSDHLILVSAQLAMAREHGFASWPRLVTEVRRRAAFDRGDVTTLRVLLAEQPELASNRMEHWCDHRKGADPLGYLAMLRFDARRLGLPAEQPAVGEMVRALLAAGAPVEGHPAAAETPLITAASYGDVEVALILIEAGADLDARATAASGALAGGTALQHAVEFGMTGVVDLLAAAGAPQHSLADAAGAGDLAGWAVPSAPAEERARALRAAAGHDRVAVIESLLAAGTPVDALDADGATALHQAAYFGRSAAVRRLLAAGADPHRRDATHCATPLGWCRHHEPNPGEGGDRAAVEAILAPLSERDDVRHR